MANRKIYERYLVLDTETGKERIFRSISDAAYSTAFFEIPSVTVYGLIGYGKERLEVALATYQDGKQIWKPEPWESFYCGKHTVIDVPVPKSLAEIRKATKPGAKRTFCALAVQMGASVTR